MVCYLKDIKSRSDLYYEFDSSWPPETEVDSQMGELHQRVSVAAYGTVLWDGLLWCTYKSLRLHTMV